MTTKTPGRPRTSEICDLRENLLRTSRELLDEGGPVVLSMREVARRAGCTHQAPYHYSASCEAVLAALVEAGFGELANRLREVRDRADTKDLRVVVEASGNAYAELALTNSGVFRVMFRRDMRDPAWFSGIPAVGKRARDEFSRFVQAITGERAIPEHEIALWVSVHGLAVLLLDGLMMDGLPTLEYQSVYMRWVNQPGAGVLMSSGKGEERDGPSAWFR